MDGILLKRNIELGSMIQGPSFVALTASFTMADTAHVKAVFGVPDVALSEVRPGSTYTVTSEALPGRRFQGTVTAIIPNADPKSRVFQVEVTIPNPQAKLNSGMIVTLEVPGSRLAQTVNVVPLPAVVRAPGTTDKYAVFVAEGNGAEAVARSRPVELGQAFGGNRVQVTGGLQPGDRVIVSGMATLRDGEKIRVEQ
jgi:multidrug efflux system membrane fusion protein